MSSPWIGELVAALGDEVVTVDPDVVAAFARDQAALAKAGTAAALVRARSVEHVTATLAFAHARRIPVVTRGAGTGLAGGANAIDGCIVLSVAKMDRILHIDTATRTARVEPGVLNGVLAREAAELGLTYAPDPASRDISTIGGNIATNAGGACCLKYGVTGDHVASLEVALADGRIVRTGRSTRKNVAGLDLTRLFVGSEGTLGVVVEATMRLLPTASKPSTLVAIFDSLADAGKAIVALDAMTGLSLVEVMDRTTIQAVERVAKLGFDASAAAVLLVQSDASDAPSAVGRSEEICRRYSPRETMRTDDADEARMLLAARRMALPALEKLGTTLLDDVAVPKGALTAMIERVEAVAARHQLVIGTFGHAGDGNLHPTIVFDNRDPSSRERALSAFDEILRAAMELGGTITGEHGVGSLKVDYMTEMVGETERALMQRIKAAFDPYGILNPGKGF